MNRFQISGFMSDEDNFLELLEIYMDMAEKQDEIIYRLGKVTKRLAGPTPFLKKYRKKEPYGSNSAFTSLY